MDAVETLREYCTFGDQRVYLLLAIAREKDQPEGVTADGPVIREVVTEAEALDRLVRQLDHAVTRFDARYRLYVTASARNTVDALFELRRRTDEWLRQHLAGDDSVARTFGRLDSEFKSTLQSETCRDETTFLFDLDGVTETAAETLRATLSEHTTVRLTRATPNGYHVVTAPFDYTSLETAVPYELKTDGLVFLSFL
jgi:hypothetical protein